jgi:menaquinone-specific isochorismate synthase
MLNYYHDAQINFELWRDRALSLLKALLALAPRSRVSQWVLKKIEPDLAAYAETIAAAQAHFAVDNNCRKVVLGRRNICLLNNFKYAYDPVNLFFELMSKSRTGFCFVLDVGVGSVFFGVSPELLYRRLGRNFETESLAGTRPRALDDQEDARLRQELFSSYKDFIEHNLVSEHIEERLKEFGATDVFRSRLEIMRLPYVQHLVKRYNGHINNNLNDETIINALHPTPAVCGLSQEWALDFIRDHENFDRGYYAGPIGYIGHDEAEFAVAIRSALYWQGQLYVYAACGIVPDSHVEQEWEELTNKQKNIMSVIKF